MSAKRSFILTQSLGFIRKALFLGVASAALFASGPASTASMTEQQVRNTCGSKLQSGSAGGQSAIGCEKKCGDKICTYGCLTKDGKQTCSGEVVGRAVAPGGAAGTAGVLDRAPATSSASPSKDIGVLRPTIMQKRAQ